MHVIAAKAVCFKEALEPEFKEYQMQVVKNAKRSVRLKKRGVKIVSGDTDNHLMLVDLTGNDVSGKELENGLTMHILHVIKYNTERSSFSVRDKRSKTRNSGSYNSGNERGRYG